MLVFDELPDGIRVKLSGSDEEALWDEVEARGIADLAQGTRYSRSRIYGWRSKDLFLPAGFVSRFLDSPDVVAMKGEGRGEPLMDPGFPMEPDDELLTRIECSVSVNREGVPVYRTGERELVERFRRLISRYGDVPLKVYSRSAFELRYPKFLHRVLMEMEHRVSFPALVDEEGRVEGGRLIAGGREVPVEEFDGELHSRDMQLELAIEREDEEEMERLVEEEVERVRRAFG